MTHEEFKEKLAEKLTESDAPCHSCHLIDEVATFCDKDDWDDFCNPKDCWLRVFEIIEKENEE